MTDSAFDEAEVKDPRHESREGRGFFGRPVLFIRQVISEIRRVVTPTVEEWRRYTIVVGVFVIVVVVIVMAMDFVFGVLIERVFGE